MKSLFLLFALASLFAVEAQNVFCNFQPQNAVTVDFIPIKAYRTFGEHSNRENWCISHCQDCVLLKISAAFNLQKSSTILPERSIVNQQSASNYEKCPNKTISSLVESTILSNNNIDDIATSLQKTLKNPGWAYLLVQHSFSTSTFSSMIPFDNNLCSMYVTNRSNGTLTMFHFFSGLIRV